MHLREKKQGGMKKENRDGYGTVGVVLYIAAARLFFFSLSSEGRCFEGAEARACALTFTSERH